MLTCVCLSSCVYVPVLLLLQALQWLTVCRSTAPHPSPPLRLPPAGVGAQEDVTLLQRAQYQLRAPQVAATQDIQATFHRFNCCSCKEIFQQFHS